MIHQIRSNPLLKKLANFSAIGALNTIIHTGVVISLVEGTKAHPTLANTIAFAIANIFSYWANGRWNFKSKPNIKQYSRFFLVSILGLTCTIAVSTLAEAAGWHYLIGLGMVFIALPTFTFILHWRWTYKQ
jgi:putative flippase GtrA